MMDILRFGVDCEVLAPLGLRTRVSDEILQMGELYK